MHTLVLRQPSQWGPGQFSSVYKGCFVSRLSAKHTQTHLMTALGPHLKTCSHINRASSCFVLSLCRCSAQATWDCKHGPSRCLCPYSTDCVHAYKQTCTWIGGETQLQCELVSTYTHISHCYLFIIYCAVILLGLCNIMLSRGYNGQPHYIFTTTYLIVLNMVQSLIAVLSLMLAALYLFILLLYPLLLCTLIMVCCNL